MLVSDPAGDPVDEELAGEEFVARARSGTRAHKVPRAVHFVDSLPPTATGKLRRFLFRTGNWDA